MRLLRKYRGFRGIDLRQGAVPLTHSPDCLNLWKDYRLPGSIRTRPSMQEDSCWDGGVQGIYFLEDQLLIHTGFQMYARGADGQWREVYDVREMGYLESGDRTASFLRDRDGDQELYILTGRKYIKYDGNAFPVEGYIPTTSIARAPAGGGQTYEPVNLLTPERINSFLADGESTDFFLDTREIDSQEGDPFGNIRVTVNGQILPGSAYTVDHAEGKVVFTEAPPAPETDGQDNVFIRFSKTVPGYRERIDGCTLAVAFDNRIFFSGNPDFPNTLWHSALNDPEYIPDLNYYEEGMDDGPIRSLVPGNNALWVFRDTDRGSAVFYHTPVLEESYGKIYPSVHSGIGTGCLAGAVNFYDDICFFSPRGMESISGDIGLQRSMRHKSSRVDRLLTTHPEYKKLIPVVWQGYLLLFMGSTCLAADSRSQDPEGYDWYLWEMEAPVLCATVHENVLYLGTQEGLYTLTGKASLPSHWVTGKDDLGYPQMGKTTNKRGCVAEVTGDVTVHAITGNGESLIGQWQQLTDYLVARIKQKKFKDIQLKFSSDSRFSLESATLECFVGGYIKR